MEEAQSRNKTQGVNGEYHGYGYESLDVVYNIIKEENITLSTKLQKNIIKVVIETLSSENQIIQAKRSALNLLQMIYFRTKNQNEIWTEVGKQMIDNSATYSIGNGIFFKDTNFLLSFQYSLFIHGAFESRREELLEKLYSTDSTEPYTIMQFLKIITDFLKLSQDQLKDDTLVSAFLYYSIFMSQHKERDIKYYAAICLIELTNFANVRRLALMQLSRIMNYGSQAAKIAILTRLSSDCFFSP